MEGLPSSHWLATMGIPSMSKNTFAATERLLGDAMKRVLTENMIESGRLEREMDIERNDVHQGVPATTVVADGGWSKRSHKHSYNAKSGVAVIFGQKTKKAAVLSSTEQILFCLHNCTEQEHPPSAP